MQYLSSIFGRFSPITELWVRENCVWNQATWHRVPPATRCVSTCMMTHDAIYVSTLSRLLDWPWVPVDITATITGLQTRGLPYVEVMWPYMWVYYVATSTWPQASVTVMFCCVICCVVIKGKVCVDVEGGHLQHTLQQ